MSSSFGELKHEILLGGLNILSCSYGSHEKDFIIYFKPKSSKEEENFLRNGSELQAGLIAFSNGWYGVPIRSFTAKELFQATNSFTGVFFVAPDGFMYIGDLEGRRVLVTKCFCNNLHYTVRNIVIATHMSHLKNVLKIVGCCLEFDVPSPVYEYVDGRTLFHLLSAGSDDKKSLLPWGRRIKIANDIASVMVFLHTGFPTPVLLTNLTPSNVMIDQYGVAKLYDFRYSISLPPRELFVKVDIIRGHFRYMDPNYLMRGYVSQKTDVYSFGMFLLELLSGKTLSDLDRLLDIEEDLMIDNHAKYYFDNHLYDKIIDMIIREEEVGFGSEDLVRFLVDLSSRCTRENEKERPEMIDVAKQLLLTEKVGGDHLPSPGLV